MAGCEPRSRRVIAPGATVCLGPSLFRLASRGGRVDDETSRKWSSTPRRGSACHALAFRRAGGGHRPVGRPVAGTKTRPKMGNNRRLSRNGSCVRARVKQRPCPRALPRTAPRVPPCSGEHGGRATQGTVAALWKSGAPGAWSRPQRADVAHLRLAPARPCISPLSHVTETRSGPNQRHPTSRPSGATHKRSTLG
jgi:hypothetical protein